MTGERWLLRAGDFLVGWAARRLPAGVRDERRREWAAELPVILGDPEVKPAAARAARMLWFAADTLRGAALRPDRGRRRWAHRGTAGKNARRLGVLASALTAMAALLALLALMIYQTIFGVNLAYYVAFMLTSLASLAGCFFSPLAPGRDPGRAIRSWFSVGAVAAATGPLVGALASHLGWGHPLLFTVISDCGGAACFTCNGVAGAIAIRSARRARRPDPGPLR